MTNKKLISSDDIYTLMDLYFARNNIMYSHLHKSYDKFIDHDIRTLLMCGQNIFHETSDGGYHYKYRFTFEDIKFKPNILDTTGDYMSPNYARTHDITYGGKLFATIKQYQDKIDIATDEVITRLIGEPEENYPVANLPIMVGSKYCPTVLRQHIKEEECQYDSGGYFIVNGSEKAMITLERIVDGVPLVFTKKESSSISYKVQIHSKNYDTDALQIVSIRMKKNESMILQVPILNEIPVFILLKALGIETDKDIILATVYDLNDIEMINSIRTSLNDCVNDNGDRITSKEEAVAYLLTKVKILNKNFNSSNKEDLLIQKKKDLEHKLKHMFLPHEEPNLRKKGFFIGYMINRLLSVKLGRIPVDDRDSFVNKRLDLAGDHLYELFKQAFKKVLNDCGKQFIRKNKSDVNPFNVITHIKPNVIEQGIKTTLLTGSLGKKKGVAQILQRFTYVQALAILRRIKSPTSDVSTNKLTSPRHLHPSQLGPVCVTGDTEVLLSDGVTTKQIKDFTNDDKVLTINKDNLSEEPSKIKNFFKKMPSKLLKITTIFGDTIKCTPEHPFLIKDNNSDDKFIFKKAGELKRKDLVVIKNTNNHLRREKNIEPSLRIKFTEFKNQVYRDDIDIGSDEDFTEYFKRFNLNEGIKLIPIKSIIEVKNLEPVYDFTTLSNNHSFVANNFVTHNCYIETPEGQQVGLVKSLSMMGNITIALPSQIHIIEDLLEDKYLDVLDIPKDQIMDYTKIFLNGKWLGMTDKPHKIYNFLREKKINGEISLNTSIIHNINTDIECNEIKIFCDGGRLYRPLLVVNENELALNKSHINMISNKLTKVKNTSKKREDAIKSSIKIKDWNEFMLKNPGVIEYVDTDEQACAVVADSQRKLHEARDKQINSLKHKVDKNINHRQVLNRYDENTYVKYTHCEIHPSMLMGIVAANTPFANHNQGPRDIYQYSQAKQALGIYASNYRHRSDISYVLNHPQKPMVSTRAMKYIHSDVLPAGENAVVAIACYTGYNQEDSIIMNQSAVDRGLFRAKSIKKWKAKIEKNQSTSQDDQFVKPDPNIVANIKCANYDKLNERGHVPEEVEIGKDDILLSKISPIKSVGENGKSFKDASQSYKSQVPAVVDRVYEKIRDAEGYEIKKMTTRSERVPIIGDKFCTRAGQKGTVGITLPRADMPFTKDGISPDIIMNANAMPSRMTMGQLIECLCGKVGAMRGHEVDGTPFVQMDIEKIKDMLEELGYKRDGTEYLYNGMTGEKIKSMIFIGPTYYQRLKHMVSDKIHSRARGPTTTLVRQPPEGRSRDGGLRFGEMERDCVISHGASIFLKERTVETADRYPTYVCGECGLFARRKLTENINNPRIYYCPACKNEHNISKIVIPYAFKLFLQEMMSMNIAPRIRIK